MVRIDNIITFIFILSNVWSLAVIVRNNFDNFVEINCQLLSSFDEWCYYLLLYNNQRRQCDYAISNLGISIFINA